MHGLDNIQDVLSAKTAMHKYMWILSTAQRWSLHVKPFQLIDAFN